jgi:transcriptional regulator with XRE-family HTH domain
MFYDNFIRLCAEAGKAPSAVAEEVGLYKSTVSNWKNRGTKPTDTTAQKIAAYFGVPVSELYEDKKETPAFSEEDERKTIEAILNSLSREELLDLMAKTAEKLKERG